MGVAPPKEPPLKHDRVDLADVLLEENMGIKQPERKKWKQQQHVVHHTKIFRAQHAQYDYLYGNGYPYRHQAITNEQYNYNNMNSKAMLFTLIGLDISLLFILIGFMFF